MSLFANYRADRLIAEVKSSGNPGSPLAQKALEKLVALGPSAIEPIVDALTTAEKRETVAYVEALSRLIDAKSLPQLFKTMAEANNRAMSGIAWALSSSKNYPPNALLDALGSFFSFVGDQRRALEAFERAVALAPDQAHFIFNRATVRRFLGQLAAADLRPDGDLHASSQYRRHVAGVLTRRALGRAIERAR